MSFVTEADEVLSKKPQRRIDWVVSQLRKEATSPSSDRRDLLFAVLARKDGRALLSEVTSKSAIRLYEMLQEHVELFTPRQQRQIRNNINFEEAHKEALAEVARQTPPQKPLPRTTPEKEGHWRSHAGGSDNARPLTETLLPESLVTASDEPQTAADAMDMVATALRLAKAFGEEELEVDVAEPPDEPQQPTAADPIVAAVEERVLAEETDPSGRKRKATSDIERETLEKDAKRMREWLDKLQPALENKKRECVKTKREAEKRKSEAKMAVKDAKGGGPDLQSRKRSKTEAFESALRKFREVKASYERAKEKVEKLQSDLHQAEAQLGRRPSSVEVLT